MKSSRATVSIALRSRSERRSPRRPSSLIFASRSRRSSSSLLTGRLGGGMSHPLIGPRRRRTPPACRRDVERLGRRTSQPATLGPTRPALVLVPRLATTSPMDLDLRGYHNRCPF
jgi:hypothetical protein